MKQTVSKSQYLAGKIYFVFAGLVFGIYGQTILFKLLWFDDYEHICKNIALNPVKLSGLLDIWLSPYFGLYTPVTYTAWSLPMLLSQLVGQPGYNCVDSAPWIHGFSILLHLGNVFLVYQLLKKISSQEKVLIPLLGALLFAAHPLSVEAVAWASSTRDLLSAFFGFFACLLCLQGRSRWALVMLALSMLSKPSGVVFAVLAILLIWNQEPQLLRVRWRFISCSLLLGAAVSWITKIIQPDKSLSFDVPFLERPLFYAQAIGFYFWKMILPLELGPDYGRSAPAIIQNPVMLLLGFIVIPAGILVWRFPRMLLLPFLWIAVAILPVSGLVNFGFEEISTVADRYAYVAIFGLSILLCKLMAHAPQGNFNVLFSKSKVWIVGTIILLLAIKSVVQTRVWADDKTLFLHGIAMNPKSSISFSNLGNAFFQEGNFIQAEQALLDAININPKNSLAWLSLGRARERLGRSNESALTYRKSIELGVALPQTFNNLGAILASTGNLEEAQKNWNEAIRLNPRYMDPVYNLGLNYLNQKKYSEAAKAFEKASEISPSDPRPRSQLELVRRALPQQ